MTDNTLNPYITAIDLATKALVLGKYVDKEDAKIHIKEAIKHFEEAKYLIMGFDQGGEDIYLNRFIQRAQESIGELEEKMLIEKFVRICDRFTRKHRIQYSVYRDYRTMLYDRYLMYCKRRAKHIGYFGDIYIYMHASGRIQKYIAYLQSVLSLLDKMKKLETEWAFNLLLTAQSRI